MKLSCLLNYTDLLGTAKRIKLDIINVTCLEVYIFKAMKLSCLFKSTDLLGIAKRIKLDIINVYLSSSKYI